MASVSGIRAACEYCHRRKIRCIISPKSNSCHNCTATGVLCYFAPRLKSGRPRRATSHSLPPSTSGRSTPSDYTDDGFDASNYNVGALNVQPPMQLSIDQSQWPRYTTPEYLTAARSSSSPAPSSLSIASQPEISFGDGITPITSAEENEFLDFEATLRLCSDIDHRARILRDFPSTADAEGHIQALDAVCKASITIQANSDSASQSMVLAILYKALEICQVLVQACSSATPDISHIASLRKVHMLRRIDTSVMFFKICFAHMGNGHAGGVLEAEELHANIEQFLRLNYGNWIWR